MPALVSERLFNSFPVAMPGKSWLISFSKVAPSGVTINVHDNICSDIVHFYGGIIVKPIKHWELGKWQARRREISRSCLFASLHHPLRSGTGIKRNIHARLNTEKREVMNKES